jgi:hypothetical protein
MLETKLVHPVIEYEKHKVKGEPKFNARGC